MELIRCRMCLIFFVLFAFSGLFGQAPKREPAKQLALPNSKLLFEPVPGLPRPLNSFPATTALSSDEKDLAILNQGWGVTESKFQQSIAILDLETNRLTDFPDTRLGHRQKQTYFYGLAWSLDGHHLYASIGSLTDPEAKSPHTGEQGAAPGAEGDIGNGIAVYRFDTGTLTPERFIPISPQPLNGKKRSEGLKNAPDGTAPPFPAGIAVVQSNDGERLLVANNFADNALLIDAQTGNVIHRFDLSEHSWIPAEYPLHVVVSRDSRHAWVSLWNASKVKELDLASGNVIRTVELRVPQIDLDAGSHPSVMLLSPDEKLLYCALANADAIAMIATSSGKVLQTLSTQLPKQRRPGVYPLALAQSADGKYLYVADAGADAVALFDTTASTRFRVKGFIPTEWYPTSISAVKNDLIITTAKGKGTGPNSQEWAPQSEGRIARTNHPYILSLLAGSIARVNLQEAERDLAALTDEVVRSNQLKLTPAQAPWKKSPIQHAIYIIKENRSYDQVFGDIQEANGDPSLVMYGEEITPNHHKLARQFGVLDNFYVSGEVSGDGHVWSTASTGTDYTEATVPIGYRNAQRTYDYEGTNLDEVVLEHGVPDVNEPGTGYLWTNAARRGISYREYGEYIDGIWCDVPSADRETCPKKTIEKGQTLPANVGEPHGSPSPYPWKIPVLARSVATKRELRNHFDPLYAGWNLAYPDQLRADEFLNEFQNFVRARQNGDGPGLPALVIVKLPNDHTSGTRAGAPKPEAQLADNDLALGRIVEAVSNSPYWEDTAIFVLEDDAQNGPDHVDAHRSPALVISKYSPQPSSDGKTPQQAPYVDSHFYTTVNMVRTIEDTLGLAPMNHSDAQAVAMWTMFSSSASQPPYHADWRNRDNGLIYQVNSANAPGASASARMDFSHADAVDPEILNQILWQDAKGSLPMPETPNRLFSRQQ